MNYYTYEELKQKIKLEEEYRTKFREQTEIERVNLKKALLYHKEVIEPFKVKVTLSGFTLIDGHHRWGLLPEVMEECLDFNPNIPVIAVGSKDASDVMLMTQLGRRNLTNEEIVEYVGVLIKEDGLTANKAYKRVAEATGKSKSTIQRIYQPELAEVERIRQTNERIGISDEKLPKLGKKTPETLGTSLDTFSTEPALRRDEAVPEVTDEAGDPYEMQKQIRKNNYLSNKYQSQPQFTNKKRKSTSEPSYEQKLEEVRQKMSEYDSIEDDEIVSKVPTVSSLVDKEARDKFTIQQLEGICDVLHSIKKQVRNNDLKVNTIHISNAISEYEQTIMRLTTRLQSLETV